MTFRVCTPGSATRTLSRAASLQYSHSRYDTTPSTPSFPVCPSSILSFPVHPSRVEPGIQIFITWLPASAQASRLDCLRPELRPRGARRSPKRFAEAGESEITPHNRAITILRNGNIDGHAPKWYTLRALTVGYRSGQPGQTVNLLAYAFDGSNPSPTTRLRQSASAGQAPLNTGALLITSFLCLALFCSCCLFPACPERCEKSNHKAIIRPPACHRATKAGNSPGAILCDSGCDRAYAVVTRGN